MILKTKYYTHTTKINLFYDRSLHPQVFNFSNILLILKKIITPSRKFEAVFQKQVVGKHQSKRREKLTSLHATEKFSEAAKLERKTAQFLVTVHFFENLIDSPLRSKWTVLQTQPVDNKVGNALGEFHQNRSKC